MALSFQVVATQHKSYLSKYYQIIIIFFHIAYRYMPYPLALIVVSDGWDGFLSYFEKLKRHFIHARRLYALHGIGV